MGIQHEIAGSQELDNSEGDKALWLLVFTPLVLSAAFTIAAFVFGSAGQTPFLMAAGPLMNSPYMPSASNEAGSTDAETSPPNACESAVWEGSAFDWTAGVEGAEIGAVDCVWPPILTVGEAEGTDGTILGYESRLSPGVGEVEGDEFSYWRRGFIVDGPWYLEESEDSAGLSSSAGQQLPFGMLLWVGGDGFLLPHAGNAGGSGDYLWESHEAPGRDEGQTPQEGIVHNPFLRSSSDKVW